MPPHRLTLAGQSTWHCQLTALCHTSTTAMQGRSPASCSLLSREIPAWQMSHQAQGCSFRAAGYRGSPLPGDCVGMVWASTLRARARESQDTSALRTGNGDPRCARRWLELRLAPAQPKSLPLPACSPGWIAAAPFPPQLVCLPLALISCALSPPPPLSPAHPTVCHTAQAGFLRPASLPANIPACIPAHFTGALCSLHSSLQRPMFHPGCFPHRAPHAGRGWDGDSWAIMGHKD